MSSASTLDRCRYHEFCRGDWSLSQMFVVLYTAACGPMGNRHRNSNITNAYTYTDAWMNATYTYA